ncbi:hypothetical protein [Aerococcus urinae]|uniref:hypothetical protein n=1 Tax=Aerococcus urinae TaxID=1376 RepID=UPI0025505E21|nr:hypothetical protein [Aerococcus urinae]MDK7301792.1 hypothetical protein [Aerococcus urinae]
MNTTKDDLIKDISNQTKIIQNSINAISSRETNPNIKAIQGAVNNITTDLFWLKPAPEGDPEAPCCLTAEHLNKVANALNPTLFTIQKQEMIDKVIRMASCASGVNSEFFQELKKAQHDLDEDFQNQIKRQGETLETIYCLLCNSYDEAEVKSSLEALGIDY